MHPSQRPLSYRLPSWLLLAAMILMLGLSATPAMAQRARKKPTQPPPAQQPTDHAPNADPDGTPVRPAPTTEPADMVNPAADPEDETKAVDLAPTPYLSRRSTTPWTLKVEVLIQSYQDAPRGPTDERELTIIPLDFTSATMVFPVLVTTSSSNVLMKETESGEQPRLTGEVRINDRPAPQDLAFVSRGIDGDPLPSNTWRAQWLIANPDRSAFTNVRQFDLRFDLPVECSQTMFDERKASAIDWPKGEWPEAARVALDPEAFIEYNPADRNRPYPTDAMDKMLADWFKGNDPKKLKPVVLAKWIAGNLLEAVQPSGHGLVFDRRTSMITGFDLQNPPTTASTGRGSGFDMTNLLVAMYRRVGIPARLVIGYDVGAAKEGKTIYDRNDGNPELRAWAEFCLYDEENATFGWIPVDIVAMRERSSRMPPNYLERPAKYFGTHDELDEVIPLAHHYAPAKTSTWFYEYPALWGWFVQPSPPPAGSQTIRLNASRTAVRSTR